MKFDGYSVFQDFLASQRENLLVWVPIFLGIGAALYFGLTNEPSFFTTSGLLGGCIALFLSLYRLYHRRGDSLAVLTSLILAGCLLCMATGFTAAQIKTDIVATPMLNRETRPVMVTGILDHREDQEGKKGTLLFLSNVHIDKWDATKTPVKIRVTSKQKTDAKAGDKVQFLAKLTPLSPPVAPGAYDFARHYYFESIGALGYTLSPVTVLEQSDAGIINLENIRTSISNHIKTVVSEREAGIVAALMTGERAAIADEDWDALRASGLAHIISISGLHVAMVAAPVFFVVRLMLAMIPFVALRYPIKKIAAAVALVVCCLYVGLVVPSVPTTRALLMTGVALIAIMLDRSPFSLRLVAFSAILVLLVAPESIWSVSFQMSFAAVTALVAMAEGLRPYVSGLYADAGWFKKSLLFVVGTLLTSLVASIATAPYSLYHFQQLASYSVLANALSVPISGLMIMPMVIISFALLPFGAADWSLKIMGLGVDWLLDIARWTQGLAGAVLTTSSMPDLFMVMMTVSGLVLILLQGRGRLLAVLPLVVALIAIVTTKTPDVLVSNDGAVMAVRAGHQVYVSNIRKNKFVTETWLKRWNKSAADVVLFPKQSTVELDGGGSISCDPAACRIIVGSTRISFGTRHYELKQDCAWANILVSDKRLPRNFCAPYDVQVFGYYNFKDKGALSIDTTKGGVRIEQTNDNQGIRPWK